MGYLAYSSETEAAVAGLRAAAMQRYKVATTWGYGPRFLHSTGQFHKGGPAEGVYLQITADPTEDLAVPGKEYTFGRLIASQSAGDASVLADHGRPVLRLHLTDLASGVAAVRAALA
jgi:glucose-6-phosphate isomerase